MKSARARSLRRQSNFRCAAIRSSGERDAITNAIGYANFYSRSHDAVIRVYDEARNVIGTHAPARGSVQRAVSTNRFAKIVRCFKASFHLVEEWWGIMAGGFSIPFMLLALFNAFSQRLLFVVLAYASLWALVVSQNRQIAKLKSPTKRLDIAVYDSFNKLVEQGEAMLEKFERNEPPFPTENEFQHWDRRLIALAESSATIAERDRLRSGNVPGIVTGNDIQWVYLSVRNREHWPIAEKLF